MLKRVNFTMNLFFLAALVMIPFAPVSAQLNPANFTQFTEKDGVPGAQVNSLLVDKFGYIWLGTINGLARYDGYEFKRYFNNPNDSTSIKGLVVWSLFEDRKGQIWIATGPENLNKYDPITRTFRQYEYKHLIEHPANVELGIRSMSQDANGRIYIGVSTNYGETIPGGLLYLDEAADTIKKFVQQDSLVIQNVFSIATDKLNNVWFLSFSGIFKIDPKGKLTKYQSLESSIRKQKEFPYYLQADQQNHIWIITEKSSLFDFDPVSGNVTSYAPEKPLARDFTSIWYLIKRIISGSPPHTVCLILIKIKNSL
jgi:ligand-binding sensor domain-containing protein